MEVTSVRKKVTNLTFLAVLCVLFSTIASAEVPDWLRNLARQPSKGYADDVNAVVLFEDQVTTVNGNGEIVRHGRFAMKILRPEGREQASYFARPYDNDSKVNYLHGWSITNKGQEYEAKDPFEQSASSFEIYSSLKIKVLRVPGVEVGTVVGFEFDQKARPYILQDYWDFQSVFPVEQSRYELHLAPGWRFKADWVNHREEKPSEDNGAIVWQLGDVPRIEREPHRPPIEALASRMVVTFLSDKMPNKSYRNWSEFGSWYTDLASGARQASPAVQQKVQELAPANKPMLERVKALAGFAQHDVRYAAIEIGIGGWRPHSATDIFNNRYGDCKDKATLLSAMLAEIGVKSYYIVVNATRGVVAKDSPASAGFFNHMILAVALPEASYAKPMPAMYEHPRLGHLLIFDPTNEWVPFGQIPSYEQGSYGALVGEQGGELIHFPMSAPESNGITRTAKLQLLPDGTLQGEVEDVLTGFVAAERRMFLQRRDTTDADRKKVIERLLGRSVASFKPTGNCVGVYHMTGDHERRKRDYLTKAVHLPRMQVRVVLPHISQVG